MEVAQQRFRKRAVECVWRLDRLAAAVADEQASSEGEFIAFRMSAEVVVIVKQQDPRGRSSSTPKKPRGGESANASTYDNKIVIFVDWHILNRITTGCARIFMRDLERAGVLAT